MKNIIFTLIAAFFFVTACEKEGNSDLKVQKEEELKMMYENIQESVDTVVCNDASQWSITSLGQDKYGAVKEYIAYPHSIDTANFLNMVKTYTEAEKEYHEKYNPTTTVVLSSPGPVDVECISGKATLIYED
ncbi:MAG: hypothetical protein ACRDE7_15100 [Sphingobacterium sp.]